MSTDSIHVLHVDTDAAMREAVCEVIDDEKDMELLTAETVAGGYSIATSKDIDCVIAEYEFPDGTAFELFEEIRDESPGTASILFTTVGVSELGSESFNDIVIEYLSKGMPDAEHRLADLIRSVVANRMQVGYPVPENEEDRLEALERYDIPGLSATATFDRLTRLIRNHFEIDVAFVGLIHDHEEEFVSCYGANWSSIAREDSVCTYAILEEGVTVIENVQEDPRFEHNDHLRELGVTSYAGANLKTMDGYVIGELCLINSQPRSFSDDEIVDLQHFADEVVEQLELRRRLPESDAGLSVED